MFWRMLAWSLTQLWYGRWATHDWNNVRYPPDTPEGRRAGTPLVGPDDGMFPFCILWKSKGDLDWYHKDMHTCVHKVIA